MKRRTFLGRTAGGAAGTLAAAGSAPPAAPDNRIGIGVVGCGGMGTADLVDFQRHPDVDIVAVCDVYAPARERARERAGTRAKAYSDYRRLLEDAAVDAVVVATPDHWHPLITVDACQAGKDVYVEKPVSHNVREGRLMVEAARRHRCIVQVGIQQRSGTHFQRAVKAVQDGRIGQVHFVQCWNHWKGNPAGMGFPADTAPPPDLDWDMWLGPAPLVPYNPARRNFRAWWDYAGGELTNWCIHLIDVVHWALGVDAPLSVASSGGKYYTRDCRDCPDTQEVLWEYPHDTLVRWSTVQHNSYGNGNPGWKPFGSYGILFQGTLGSLFVDRAGYEIVPQAVEHFDKDGQGSRSAYDDLTGTGLYYTAAGPAERGTTSVQHVPHVRNFLDCVKSRDLPAGDIEIGHRSTATCLLGNIALRTGRKLLWDAAAEKFTNVPEANTWLTRRYRAPWVLPGMEA